MKKVIKRIAIFLGVILILILIGRQVIKSQMGDESLQFLDNMIKKRVGMDVEVRQDDFMNVNSTTSSSDSISIDTTIVPFREIGASLGDLGRRNNTLMLFTGVTIFDANGDGRLDLFVPHRGRPIAKAENENHVLQPTTTVKPKPCALFLNQGNDAQGDPIYKSVQELLEASKDKGSRAELLFENKYTPRNSVKEDDAGVGRLAKAGIASDFNGDGRQDLLILNDYFGVPLNKPNLGFRIYPANANIGRKAKEDGLYTETTTPPFVSGDMKDGKDVTLNFGGQSEPEGRNTLLINLGDRDGDGIPEWEDVTMDAGMDLAYPSGNASVADIDRDGDLDIYICNFADPDFYGFGVQNFSGYRNELWINQIAQTGKLAFKEMALEYGVAGLHKEEDLPSSMWNKSKQKLEHNSYQEWEGKQVGEEADHSWAAHLVDYNEDGYPDLIVANDVGNRLRVYESQEGKSFAVDKKFHEAHWNGSWMGINSGDLNGDMKEDIMIANFGGNTVSIRNTAVYANDHNALSIVALSILNTIENKYAAHHTLLSYKQGEGLIEKVTDTKIEHSPYIIPDQALKQNVAPKAHKIFDQYKFDSSIAGLEFTWNPSFFDIENDGDLDVYMVGSLSRGNDGFIGDWTAGPGRLLVNETTETSTYRFKDQTLDYRLLDISDMNYDANPPYRPSPGTGWHKKDKITTYDQDSYSGMGIEATKNSKIKDLFRMHENANGVYAADLNGDGFQDLVVPHAGGYNSNLPSARNLKINFAGKELAVPAPNKVIKAPTNFEEGPTFLFINQSQKKEKPGNWVSLQLKDNTSPFNLMGIGTKVIINDRIMRRLNVGGESYGGVTANLTIGLGDEKLEKIVIHWGSGDQAPQSITYDSPKMNEVVEIERK